jgi:hypothetical protein
MCFLSCVVLKTQHVQKNGDKVVEQFRALTIIPKPYELPYGKADPVGFQNHLPMNNFE